MVNVQKVFETYSKLNCLDLLTELPGCSYSCNVDDIYYFEITKPETMVELLTSCLGDYVYDKNCTYKYKDGTKARFIKTKRYYEFKKAKSVIARVRLA